MKVTNKMLHKDVRLIGSILRKLTANVTREGYYKQLISSRKKAASAKAKQTQMDKIYLTREDGSQMRVLILKPKRPVANVPVVLFLHGGGYVLGTPEEKISFMESVMADADCIMVAPDYRLAFDAPYPAALEDSYQTLLWIKENAKELGGRNDQLFVLGESAGGGLAAALCILARDKAEVNIAFQMPLFPMLDDRCETESAKDNDAPVWNVKSNRLAWDLYLGDLAGSDCVPAYAAPARLDDFANLPPAHSYVGSIEPFYDETRIYFEHLKAAGIECTLDVYEGGFHGFDAVAPNSSLGKAARKNRAKAFRHAVNTYFKEQF